MRSAPAHLESKLRFWDFSVAQIAAAFAGIMLGVAWAKFVSPLHGMWGAMSGAYIAALAVIPVFVASQTEFDLCGLLIGALRWRRLEGRYVPGAGESVCCGYLLAVERTADPTGDFDGQLDLQALWKEPRSSPTELTTRRPSAAVATRAHQHARDGAAEGSERRIPINNNGKEQR